MSPSAECIDTTRYACYALGFAIIGLDTSRYDC